MLQSSLPFFTPFRPLAAPVADLIRSLVEVLAAPRFASVLYSISLSTALLPPPPPPPLLPPGSAAAAGTSSPAGQPPTAAELPPDLDSIDCALAQHPLAVAVAACLAAAGEAVPLPAPPADTPHFRPAVQLAVGLLVFAADAVLRKVGRHAEQDAMPPTASATATADAAAATVTSGCCGGRATATAAGEDGKLRSGEVASNGGGGGGTGAVASAAAVREVRRLLASEGSGLRAELEADLAFLRMQKRELQRMAEGCKCRGTCDG